MQISFLKNSNYLNMEIHCPVRCFESSGHGEVEEDSYCAGSLHLEQSHAEYEISMAKEPQDIRFSSYI